MTNSRISGFYNLTIEERRAKLADASHLSPPDLAPWTTGGLSAESADHMIENVVGLHSLPLGIGLNFMVNGRDVLVPFVVKNHQLWRALRSWRSSSVQAADSSPLPPTR